MKNGGFGGLDGIWMVVSHLLIAEMLTHESFHLQPFLTPSFRFQSKVTHRHSSV